MLDGSTTYVNLELTRSLLRGTKITGVSTLWWSVNSDIKDSRAGMPAGDGVS